MNFLATATLILIASLTSFSQDYAKQIYDTERAFEKAVAEKGVNAGFIEFLSPVGVMFSPEAVSGRELWRSRPVSPAALTWNPIKIEASSNGALAYSIGNSIYKPKGKSDTAEFFGHYITVWTRQPNGDYLAALDAGIDHPKPATPEPTWTPSGTAAPPETHPRNLSAGDASIGFFQMAETRGLAKAYKSWSADDVILLRDGRIPLVGRDAAGNAVDQKLFIKFAKRRSFIEAGGLAYVYSTYALVDKDGVEKEKGNFVQVWKLRGGKWLIAADTFIAIPPAKN